MAVIIFCVVLWLNLMYLRLNFCGFPFSDVDFIVHWCSSSSYPVKLSYFIFCHLRRRRHFSRFLLETDGGTARGKFLYFFLLLSGDVEVHPGPSEFLCAVCSHVVSDSDAALCCDQCNQWIHVSCEPNVSLDFYNDLVSQPVDDLWFRSQCLNGATDEATTNEPTTDKTATAEASTSAHINLHCAYLNARSIFNKRYDLAAYISTHEFDIIGITETFLDDSVHDSHILPPGYVAYRRDRDRHGGGVMILAKKGITIVHRDDLETDCEIVWIELMGLTLPIVIGVFYRPPSATMSVLEQLSLSLIIYHLTNVY